MCSILKSLKTCVLVGSASPLLTFQKNAFSGVWTPDSGEMEGRNLASGKGRLSENEIYGKLLKTPKKDF